MDSLDGTVARIRAARNARNIWREDPVLNEGDRAYRAGTLKSTREWPDWVGTPRRGRALPPSRNAVEEAALGGIK